MLRVIHVKQQTCLTTEWLKCFAWEVNWPSCVKTLPLGSELIIKVSSCKMGAAERDIVLKVILNKVLGGCNTPKLRWGYLFILLLTQFLPIVSVGKLRTRVTAPVKPHFKVSQLPTRGSDLFQSFTVLLFPAKLDPCNCRIWHSCLEKPSPKRRSEPRAVIQSGLL